MFRLYIGVKFYENSFSNFTTFNKNIVALVLKYNQRPSLDIRCPKKLCPCKTFALSEIIERFGIPYNILLSNSNYIRCFEVLWNWVIFFLFKYLWCYSNNSFSLLIWNAFALCCCFIWLGDLNYICYFVR